jgi:hypothetical protein
MTVPVVIMWDEKLVQHAVCGPSCMVASYFEALKLELFEKRLAGRKLGFCSLVRALRMIDALVADNVVGA